MATEKLDQATSIDFETDISAPRNGADFSLPTAAIMNSLSAETRREWLPDELPDITSLNEDFRYLLSETDNKYSRVELGMEYADHLRARYAPGLYSSPEGEYANQQIIPRLYLDMISLAVKRKRFGVVNKSSSKKSPYAQEYLDELLDTRTSTQQEIAEYIRLNKNVDSNVLFGNLISMIHQSRRMLHGYDVTTPKIQLDSMIQLSGMLAEIKVLNTLKQTWPDTKFGTAEQDRLGADIVIPISGQERGVLLQVKSKLRPDHTMNIYRKLSLPNALPTVSVPMHMATNNPFQMSKPDKSKLTSYVKNYPIQNFNMLYGLAEAA